MRFFRVQLFRIRKKIMYVLLHANPSHSRVKSDNLGNSGNLPETAMLSLIHAMEKIQSL